MVASAMLLVAALPSATQAKQKVAGSHASPVPKLSCSVGTAKLVAGKVQAQGGCAIGKKPAPAVWTWTAQAADLSGSPCVLGTGHGHGKTYYAPKAPNLPGPDVSSAMPGLVRLDFTVTARWGKQKAHAHKLTPVHNLDSRVICGQPPTISSPAASDPSACVWATEPTFDGVALRSGQIACPGNGSCSWQSPRPFIQSRYLTYRSEFNCQSGARGYISISVKFSLGNVVKCETSISGISSFTAMPKWGYGWLILIATINTWPASGNQYPYSDQNSWNTDWFLLKGKTDPCGGYIY